MISIADCCDTLSPEKKKYSNEILEARKNVSNIDIQDLITEYETLMHKFDLVEN